LVYNPLDKFSTRSESLGCRGVGWELALQDLPRQTCPRQRRGTSIIGACADPPAFPGSMTSETRKRRSGHKSQKSSDCIRPPPA